MLHARPELVGKPNFPRSLVGLVPMLRDRMCVAVIRWNWFVAPLRAPDNPRMLMPWVACGGLVGPILDTGNGSIFVVRMKSGVVAIHEVLPWLGPSY